MEVKIGVQHSPRELVIDSPKTPDEIAAEISAAMSGSSKDGLLTLVDERGGGSSSRSTGSPTSRSPRPTSGGSVSSPAPRPTLRMGALPRPRGRPSCVQRLPVARRRSSAARRG